MPGVVESGGKKKLNKSAFRRAKKKAEKNKVSFTLWTTS